MVYSVINRSIGTSWYSITLSVLWATLIQVIPIAIAIYVTLPVASWTQFLTLILQYHHTISGTV